MLDLKCEKGCRVGLCRIGHISPLQLLVKLLIKHGDHLRFKVKELTRGTSGDLLIDNSVEAGDLVVDDGQPHAPPDMLHVGHLSPSIGLNVEKLDTR